MTSEYSYPAEGRLDFAGRLFESPLLGAGKVDTTSTANPPSKSRWGLVRSKLVHPSPQVLAEHPGQLRQPLGESNETTNTTASSHLRPSLLQSDKHETSSVSTTAADFGQLQDRINALLAAPIFQSCSHGNGDFLDIRKPPAASQGSNVEVFFDRTSPSRLQPLKLAVGPDSHGDRSLIRNTSRNVPFKVEKSNEVSPRAALYRREDQLNVRTTELNGLLAELDSRCLSMETEFSCSGAIDVQALSLQVARASCAAPQTEQRLKPTYSLSVASDADAESDVSTSSQRMADLVEFEDSAGSYLAYKSNSANSLVEAARAQLEPITATAQQPVKRAAVLESLCNSGMLGSSGMSQLPPQLRPFFACNLMQTDAASVSAQSFDTTDLVKELSEPLVNDKLVPVDSLESHQSENTYLSEWETLSLASHPPPPDAGNFHSIDSGAVYSHLTSSNSIREESSPQFISAVEYSTSRPGIANCAVARIDSFSGQSAISANCYAERLRTELDKLGTPNDDDATTPTPAETARSLESFLQEKCPSLEYTTSIPKLKLRKTAQEDRLPSFLRPSSLTPPTTVSQPSVLQNSTHVMPAPLTQPKRLSPVQSADAHGMLPNTLLDGFAHCSATDESYSFIEQLKQDLEQHLKTIVKDTACQR